MFVIFMVMPRLSMRLLQSIQHAVFPPACPICATTLTEEQPTAATTGCCATCLNNINMMPQNTCLHCGIPMPPSLAPGPCGRCLKTTPPQQQTISLYIYNLAVRDALLAWKLQGQKAGLHWLLTAATPRLTSIFSPQDILIPVPMPIQRMRRSGIHHSADLCQGIANIVGCHMDTQILRRTGLHTRQSALHGKARQRNLRKAFALANDYSSKLEAHQKKAPQSKIWVVDDILTTGATLRHACKAMKPSKQPVFAFSFARTLSDD
jgi:predicted amidophosphoribosyltransferase